MTRHRFLDTRKSPPKEVWLEQSSSGYFRVGKGVYTQKVLKLVGLHHSPQTEREVVDEGSLRFGDEGAATAVFTSRAMYRRRDRGSGRL